jgi:hypothetical protein
MLRPWNPLSVLPNKIATRCLLVHLPTDDGPRAWGGERDAGDQVPGCVYRTVRLRIVLHRTSYFVLSVES